VKQRAINCVFVWNILWNIHLLGGLGGLIFLDFVNQLNIIAKLSMSMFIIFKIISIIINFTKISIFILFTLCSGL